MLVSPMSQRVTTRRERQNQRGQTTESGMLLVSLHATLATAISPGPLRDAKTSILLFFFHQELMVSPDILLELQCRTKR